MSQLFHEITNQFGNSRFVFDGDDYQSDRDNARLSKQYNKIFNLMSDGQWRTLNEIYELTGEPPASISAQLRHARKKKFGSHTVEKEYIASGLYRYRLLVNGQVAS